LVDVGGQDEDAGVRVDLADLRGGAQALVGVRRRHADVDDGDVGLVGVDLAQQVLGVARLADDLHAGVLEQPRDAFAQQHAVVGQPYTHGICARTVVPMPGGLTTSRRPSTIVSRSASPRSPVPDAGSAPPTPSSRTSTTAWPFWRSTDTVACSAWAYFAT